MGMSGGQQPRNCVSCGRAIGWDVNVCPYCGRDYRVQMMPGQAAQPMMSEGMKVLLYIISFLFSIVGIIIGIVYMTKPDRESKEFGQMCLILGLIGIVIGGVCIAASTWWWW